MPLIPLVTGAGRNWIVGLYLGALLLTQFEFPYHYPQLVAMRRFMVAEVTLRDLLLAAALLILLAPWRLRGARREGKEKGGDGQNRQKERTSERKPDAYF